MSARVLLISKNEWWYCEDNGALAKPRVVNHIIGSMTRYRSRIDPTAPTSRTVLQLSVPALRLSHCPNDSEASLSAESPLTDGLSLIQEGLKRIDDAMGVNKCDARQYKSGRNRWDPKN
jgi:hypothetical protein